MKKVNVKNKQGAIGWSATFDSDDIKNEWINRQVLNCSWGKPERWVKDDFEDVSEALDTREIQPDVGNSYFEYLLKAEYEIEEIDIGNSLLIDQIRGDRNILLSECDWTQLADAPITAAQKTAWKAYRQALRDFPEECDPQNLQWPSKPS